MSNNNSKSLESWIWDAAYTIRGAQDAPKYKDFILPPLEEQNEIVKRVEMLFKTADEIEARYKKAKKYVDKLTQSILAKAFRGELVPQDPNDEPAEKLLERIMEEREKVEEKRGKKKLLKSLLKSIVKH